MLKLLARALLALSVGLMIYAVYRISSVAGYLDEHQHTATVGDAYELFRWPVALLLATLALFFGVVKGMNERLPRVD